MPLRIKMAKDSVKTFGALAHDLMSQQVLLRDALSPSLAITGPTAPAKLQRRTTRRTQAKRKVMV